MEELARGNGGGDFEWAVRPQDRNRLWRARHNAYFAALGLRPGCRAISTDVCVPVSALADTIDATVADLRTLPFPAPLLGHVADGNFHVILLIDAGDAGERRAAEAVYGRMVDRAIAAGGTCTGEHGVGLGKRRALVDEAGPAIDVMRSLKRALDPHGLLNPGKVLLDAAAGEPPRTGGAGASSRLRRSRGRARPAGRPRAARCRAGTSGRRTVV